MDNVKIKNNRIPPKNVLINQYVTDKKSVNALAREYGADNTTIVSWLRKYGIKIRGVSESSRLTNCGREPANKIDCPDIDLLRRLHVDECKSPNALAKQFGVSRPTIVRWLDDAAIQRRTRQEMIVRDGDGIIRGTKKQRHYPKQTLNMLTSREQFLETVKNFRPYNIGYIAQTMSMSESTLRKYIHRFGVADDLPPSKNKSVGELEVLEFIKTVYSGRIISGDRSICNPLELDIFLPDLGIAIEYCGLWWHCEAMGRSRNYHYDKYRQCVDSGIRLITIFEDEWMDRTDQVKNYLKSVIVPAATKIFARKCSVKEIDDNDVAAAFFNDNHIQGHTRASTLFIGLYYDAVLVGVMAFGRHHRQGGLAKTSVLTRLAFSSDTCVVGGASKMLAAAKTILAASGINHIISWSDNRWSEGAVYEKLGFHRDQDLCQDYSYVRQGDARSRISKQSCQKKKIGCPPNQTEREFCKSVGLHRIWDCGKVRWTMNI